MLLPIGRILANRAASAPDALAITCGETEVTRAELESRSNRLARAYAQRGVRRGDLVTIALPNGVEFYEACFAAWKLGAVPQPISYRLPERERNQIIALAKPSLLVGAEGDTPRESASIPIGFTPDPDLSNQPIRPDQVAPTWKAVTSGGSTGLPKLIVSGQSGELEQNFGSEYGMIENGVQLVPGPLYHNAPFSLSMAGIFMGNHLVVLPKFDPVAALESIERFQVDWVNLVPTMMLRMLRVIQEDQRKYDLSSLRQVWHMAAPCPIWLKEKWIELLSPKRLIELYGGAEFQAWTVIDGAEWLEHRGSVGRPAYGEMKVLDPTGNEVGPGEEGEIFMRGPDGAPASYQYIGATARTRAGWESLGDMGYIDEGGYVFLTDRRTDMVVSGGSNVYPAEVEAALMEHRSIETCAVVGLPDADLGQRLHAVVQATEDLQYEDVHTFLESRLVRYKIPRSVRFVDKPLRDDAGKVRRSAIRDEEARRLGSEDAVGERNQAEQLR